MITPWLLASISIRCPVPYARVFRITTRNTGWIDPFPVFSHLQNRIIWKNEAAIPLRYPVDASSTLGLTRDRHILLSRNAFLYSFSLCEKIERGGDRKGGKLQSEERFVRASFSWRKDEEGTV